MSSLNTRFSRPSKTNRSGADWGNGLDLPKENFAKDHWILWTGLLVFFSIQLRNDQPKALYLLHCLLLIGLSTWLILNSSAFKNRLIFIFFSLVPLASCLQLRVFSSDGLKPGFQSAHFRLSEIRQSAKGKYWLSGLLQFKSMDEGINGKKLRLSLAVDHKNIDPSIGRWKIAGKLAKKPFSPTWQFICDDKKLIAAPNLFSRVCAQWALLRFKTKSVVAANLSSALPNTRARAFIMGLLTGQQVDQRLGHLLSRVGLTHLMAISGFHFACILAAGGLLLRSMNLSHPGYLLFPLALYFVYMGPSASVLRAAIMAIYRILTEWRNIPYRPLQGLGIGLLTWCLFWPECANELGFLLSYLCTGALLVLTRPLESIASILWPYLNLAQKHPRYGRYAKMLKMAVCANLSAHLATFAPQLYFWHFFPVASFGYNLLFPPLIGLFMPLLIVACGLCLISTWLGHIALGLLHDLFVPFLRLIDVARAWESAFWAECSLGGAEWTTAALLLLGLLNYRRRYGAACDLEKWVN